jgi:hypothetical protein
MRSEHHESFREGTQHSVTAPGDVGTIERTPIPTPAALWLETVDSVFKWYGTLLRLAFGLGRIDGRGEAQGLIAPPPPVKPEESTRNSAPHSTGPMSGSGEAQSLIASPAPLTPSAESSRVAALRSVPTAPGKLRPKRSNTASRGKNKTRSSKMSSIKRRHRRAA